MPKDPRLKHLSRRIDSIELSQHARKCLQQANVRTVRQLATLTEAELSKLKGCGPKAVREIREALAQMDLTLGTVLDARGQITSPALELIEKTRKLRQMTEKH